MSSQVKVLFKESKSFRGNHKQQINIIVYMVNINGDKPLSAKCNNLYAVEIFHSGTYSEDFNSDFSAVYYESHGLTEAEVIRKSIAALDDYLERHNV